MEINLIPKEETDFRGPKEPVKKALIISFSTVLLLVGFLGIRYLVSMLNSNNLQSKENSLASQEETLKDYKDSFEKYRKNHPAISIIGSHVYFSKFLKKVEEITPQSIHFTNFSVDENYLAIVNADTSGYLQVFQFVDLLKKESFSDAKLKSLSISRDKTTFTVEFRIPTEMVLK